MGDLADKANDYAEHERQTALKNARQSQAVSTATECIECGDEIPAARRKAVPHTNLCVFCQEINESFK